MRQNFHAAPFSENLKLVLAPASIYDNTTGHFLTGALQPPNSFGSNIVKQPLPNKFSRYKGSNPEYFENAQ